MQRYHHHHLKDKWEVLLVWCTYWRQLEMCATYIYVYTCTGMCRKTCLHHEFANSACEQLPQNLVGLSSLSTGKSNSFCFASVHHCVSLISWNELDCVQKSKQQHLTTCPSVTQRPQRGQRSHCVFGAGVPRLSSLDTSSWGLFIVEELQEGTGDRLRDAWAKYIS